MLPRGLESYKIRQIRGSETRTALPPGQILYTFVTTGNLYPLRYLEGIINSRGS